MDKTDIINAIKFAMLYEGAYRRHGWEFWIAAPGYGGDYESDKFTVKDILSNDWEAIEGKKLNGTN